MHPKEFKVAIVGGGMGGLSLAVGLIRGGVNVDVFEQAPKFEEIGAGVGIGPNGIRALHGLGILDAVLARAEEPLALRSFVFLSGLPGHEIIYNYPTIEADLSIAVHRAHFLDTIVNLVDPGVAHFNKKCTTVTQDVNGVTITFEDGTTHTADVVIGCDGVKSAVRATVVGRPANPRFTRTVAFRGLIPEKDGISALGDLILHRPMAFLGPDRHIIVFPLKGKHLTNVVVFSTDRSKPAEEQAPPPGQPWVVPSTQEEMLAHFQGWGPKVLDLLAFIKRPSKWLLHAQDPTLDSYVRGKIALLGDAAHSTLPHLGAGAGQAIEDAFLLSQLLTHPLANSNNLEPILQVYDHIRRPRANSVVHGSYASGEIYEHAGPSGGTKEGIRKDLTNMWDFVWHHDLDEDFRAAVKILEEKQVFKN